MSSGGAGVGRAQESVPALWRLMEDGYPRYAALCPSCGLRRGWRTIAGAVTHAAELGRPNLTPESYVPAPNAHGVCACAIA